MCIYWILSQGLIYILIFNSQWRDTQKSSVLEIPNLFCSRTYIRFMIKGFQDYFSACPDTQENLPGREFVS